MMLITATAILLATGVSAHTIFTQLHVNGVAQGHLKGVRVPVIQYLSLYSILPLTYITTDI
jgi:hypothetical protein